MPLLQVLGLKPKDKAPTPPALVHIGELIVPDLVDYGACDSYSLDLSESLLIKEGKIMFKGKVYKVIGLMRMLAIAHAFNDEEVFAEIGRTLKFRISGDEAEVVKGPTSMNLDTVGEGYKNTPKSA